MILHECSCFIGFINQVQEKRLNARLARDIVRGLASILLLFCNEFDKFNNTRTRMLDSIFHMTYLSHTNYLKSHFRRENNKTLLV